MRFLLVLPVLLTAFAAFGDARALLDSGEIHEKAGRLEEAVRDYAAARDEATRTGDKTLLGDALVELGYVQYYRGEMNEALANLQRAYEIHTANGNAAGRREALEHIAHVYADSKLAQYDRAVEYYRQLLHEYEAAGEGTNVADTLFNLGSTVDRKGDPVAALEWYRRALAAEEKLGRRGEAAYVKRSVAIALNKLERPIEALPLLDDALRVFIETKDTDRAMATRQSRGIVYTKVGRLAEAVADLETTRDYYRAQQNTRFLEKTEDELAAAYAAAGRWHDAYDARSRHSALQSNLAEKLREEQTTRMRVRFDVEKKEQENRALLREKASAERIRLLQWVVLILGAAVIAVLALLARRMRTMALTDELTRLSNRRHLLSVAEVQRASGEPFSVVAIDIDHFKRINDTFGHAAGDVVLQRVAQACRAALRPGDRIGRTGGEEMSVILPNAGAEEAARVAERLRAAVEALEFRDVGAALRVTISLGVAEWNGEETLARVTARADERLYRAKEEGRNRVAA